LRGFFSPVASALGVFAEYMDRIQTGVCGWVYPSGRGVVVGVRVVFVNILEDISGAVPWSED